jgi:DNA-binding transcriptional ArsR family regulator
MLQNIGEEKIQEVAEAMSNALAKVYKKNGVTTINKLYVGKIMAKILAETALDRELVTLLYNLSKATGKVNATDEALGKMMDGENSADSVQYHLKKLRDIGIIESDGKKNRRKGKDGWYATRRIRFTKNFTGLLDTVWKHIQKELLQMNTKGKSNIKAIKEYIRNLNAVKTMKALIAYKRVLANKRRRDNAGVKACVSEEIIGPNPKRAARTVEPKVDVSELSSNMNEYSEGIEAKLKGCHNIKIREILTKKFSTMGSF